MATKTKIIIEIKKQIDEYRIDVDELFNDSDIIEYGENNLNLIDKDDVETFDEGDEVYPCVEVKTGTINSIVNAYIEQEIKDLYVKLGPNALLEILQNLNIK